MTVCTWASVCTSPRCDGSGVEGLEHCCTFNTWSINLCCSQDQRPTNAHAHWCAVGVVNFFSCAVYTLCPTGASMDGDIKLLVHQVPSLKLRKLYIIQCSLLLSLVSASICWFQYSLSLSSLGCIRCFTIVVGELSSSTTCEQPRLLAHAHK